MKRGATLGILVIALVGVFGDFIASDRPIVLHRAGTTYWLANLFDYAEVEERGLQLSDTLDESDWAVWAPIRHGPYEVRSAAGIDSLASPSREHWLGTDDRGRDVLARIVHGARTSCLLAAWCAFLAALFGGLVAMSATRWPLVDPAVAVILDAISAVPLLVLVVAVQGLWGTASLGLAAALIAVPRAADCARLARAEMRRAQAQPFAMAARAAGVGQWRLLWRHLFPFSWRPVAVVAAVTAATAVVAEAGLSFVGFGAPPPTASWGEIMRQAVEHDLRWWLAVPAGVLVSVLAASVLQLARAHRRFDGV